VPFDWTPSISSKAISKIKVETKDAKSNGGNGSIMLGGGKEDEKKHKDIFDIGVKGELDIMTTNSTSDENEMEINIYLDEPIETMTDQCTKLNVDVYWLKPNHSEGVDNWWLPEGAKGQDAWCITYVVTDFKKDVWPEEPNNGRTVIDDNLEVEVVAEQVDQTEETPEETEPAAPSNGRMGEQLLSDTKLLQNYPNPFSSMTKIQYRIGDSDLQGATPAGATRLVVYDFNGKEIATLVNENQGAGNYEVEWDASTNPPGIYLYSLQNGDYREVKKLILLK
jgi:hypothetical protein